MRIGIVAHWFNRGQGVVARHLRSALDELGHDTFVLARPTRATNRRPAFVDRGDVWDQPEVTEASTFAIPAAEYEQWAAGRRLDAVFFDQNYQFEEIAGLRRRGVTTLARFVWEAFSPADVAGAREAFDVIYSVTECEQRRYAELGIDSPRVVWGCHPELLGVRPEREEPPEHTAKLTPSPVKVAPKGEGEPGCRLAEAKSAGRAFIGVMVTDPGAA